ncbi:MAG: CaiB/BaiF CoA transferase family protein [Acidimicrobiales bacterium]
MPGPLEGYKVVDLSQVVSGPLATMIMADQGAEVVKVEPTAGLGDLTRLPSFDKGGISAFYLNNNRGKRSLAVDLSVSEGQQLVLDLAAGADVFVQNFRPGAIERLGLGYEDIKKVNPDVVYVSISGFGPTGPYSSRPVWDPVIQGICGVIDRQLNPEVPFPDLIRNLYADKSTALTTVQAITAALLARERGHGGQLVEVPMLDACMYFFWPDGMMDLTLTDEDANHAGIRLAQVYNLTECSDGKIVYFAASDAQRKGVSIAVSHPEWAEDPRFATMAALAAEPQNFVVLGELLADAFRELTCEEAIAALVAADVPCGPVLTAEEAIVDEQVVHNQTLVEWQHPDGGTVRQPRPAARFEKTPAEVAANGAHRGQHSDEILAELGRSDEEIERLREAGVVAG